MDNYTPEQFEALSAKVEKLEELLALKGIADPTIDIVPTEEQITALDESMSELSAPELTQEDLDVLSGIPEETFTTPVVTYDSEPVDAAIEDPELSGELAEQTQTSVDYDANPLIALLSALTQQYISNMMQDIAQDETLPSILSTLTGRAPKEARESGAQISKMSEVQIESWFRRTLRKIQHGPMANAYLPVDPINGDDEKATKARELSGLWDATQYPFKTISGAWNFSKIFFNNCCISLVGKNPVNYYHIGKYAKIENGISSIYNPFEAKYPKTTWGLVGSQLHIKAGGSKGSLHYILFDIPPRGAKDGNNRALFDNLKEVKVIRKTNTGKKKSYADSAKGLASGRYVGIYNSYIHLGDNGSNGIVCVGRATYDPKTKKFLDKVISDNNEFLTANKKKYASLRAKIDVLNKRIDTFNAQKGTLSNFTATDKEFNEICRLKKLYCEEIDNNSAYQLLSFSFHGIGLYLDHARVYANVAFCHNGTDNPPHVYDKTKSVCHHAGHDSWYYAGRDGGK